MPDPYSTCKMNSVITLNLQPLATILVVMEKKSISTSSQHQQVANINK